eukprot:8186296-Alexandrium_andersonii.AAC.1
MRGPHPQTAQALDPANVASRVGELERLLERSAPEPPAPHEDPRRKGRDVGAKGGGKNCFKCGQ